MHLFVSQKIGGQGWQVVRPCIRVALSPRSVVLEDDDGTAPVLLCCTGSDVVDGAVDRGGELEGGAGIPKVEGKAEGLAIQTLREDDTVDLVVLGEVHADERVGTHALRRDLGWTAFDGGDSGPFCDE